MTIFLGAAPPPARFFIRALERGIVMVFVPTRLAGRSISARLGMVRPTCVRAPIPLLGKSKGCDQKLPRIQWNQQTI